MKSISLKPTALRGKMFLLGKKLWRYLRYRQKKVAVCVSNFFISSCLTNRSFYIFCGLTFAAAKISPFQFFFVYLNLQDQQKLSKNRPRWHFSLEGNAHKYFEINVLTEFTSASFLFIYVFFFVVRRYYEKVKAWIT